MALTPFGLKAALFYLAMTGAFLASPYSNLFFLLVAFLTLQGLLCAVWTLRNLVGVTAELSAIPPVPAGAGSVVGARLHAPRRTRFQVAIEVELPEGTCTAQANVLHPGAADVNLSVPPLPRGLHRVRRACVSSTFPFGVLRARHEAEAPAEVVVYPAPAELVSARSGSEALAEVLGGASGQGDLQPSGLRDFREGDEPRGIHWRATARRGALVIKEWEGSGGEGLELLLDRRCESEALEAALSLMSAVVAVARDSKEVLAIYSQGMHATFGEGHRPWSDALRFLAGADLLPPDGPPPPPVSSAVTRLPLENAHAG